MTGAGFLDRWPAADQWALAGLLSARLGQLLARYRPSTVAAAWTR